MATLRLIFIVRGARGIAAGIGFVEVLIWVVAAGHALQHLDSVLHVVGYAAGFATGSYVGIWLEGFFALGLSAVRAVCRPDEAGAEESSAAEAARAVREAGFAVTELEGHGRDGNVRILNLVVPRKRVPEVVRLLQKHDPDAFITVEEIRSTRGGYFQLGGRKTPFLRHH